METAIRATESKLAQREHIRKDKVCTSVWGYSSLFYVSGLESKTWCLR